jgi:hypothetical protein
MPYRFPPLWLTPRETVHSLLRATSTDPLRYYFEIWTDLEVGIRLASETSRTYTTRGEAARACKEELPRYRERMGCHQQTG